MQINYKSTVKLVNNDLKMFVMKLILLRLRLMVAVAELKRVAYQDGVTAGYPHLGLGVIDLTPPSSHISRLDDGDPYLGSSYTRSTHAFSDRTFLDELLHSHTYFQHYRSCKCDKLASLLQVSCQEVFSLGVWGTPSVQLPAQLSEHLGELNSRSLNPGPL